MGIPSHTHSHTSAPGAYPSPLLLGMPRKALPPHTLALRIILQSEKLRLQPTL